MSLKKYSIISYKYRIFVLMIICAILLFGCKSFDYLTKIENTFPLANTCGDCHVDIFHEWSQSAHAHAFTISDFLANTNDAKFSDCLSCHVPEPKLSMERPVARNILYEDGVTCTSCHLEEGKMLGPIESTAAVQPHPIKVNKVLYTDASFCGRCHEGTYQQWQTSTIDSKKTCQQCHMPSVVRKVTQGKDAVSNFLVSMEKTATLRRHTFMIYPKQEDSVLFDIETSFDSNSVTIELENKLPHSFPTGNFGVQIGVLLVKFINENGFEISSERKEFIQELKTNIPSGKSKELKFNLPENSKKIDITISREGRSGKKLVELLNKEVLWP